MMNHDLQQVWYYCFRNNPAPDFLFNGKNFTLTLSSSNCATRLKLHRLALPIWRLDRTNPCPILNLRFWRRPRVERIRGRLQILRLNSPWSITTHGIASAPLPSRMLYIYFEGSLRFLDGLTFWIILLLQFNWCDVGSLFLAIGSDRIYHKGCDSM